MMSLMARIKELCRIGNDGLVLDSNLTTVVVTGRFLPDAWSVDPRKNSVRLLVDEC